VRFWKRVALFRKSINMLLSLLLMWTICLSLVKLHKLVLSILKSVFRNVYLCNSDVVTPSSDSLSLASVCCSKPLKKSVGIDYFLAFNTKRCLDIFVHILKFIFNRILPQRSLSHLEASCFETTNGAVGTKYGPSYLYQNI